MKHFTLTIALLITVFAYAQNTGELVVFSNLGDPFYLILNGEKQNQKAETNVKVQGLTPGFYSCKVLSENNLYVFDKNFEIKENFQTSYRIVEKSGVPKMRYFSETAIKGNEQVTSGQTVVVYHPVPAPATTTQSTTTQTTSTTTNSTGTVGSGTTNETAEETVNVGIQINENGIGTTITTNGTETGGEVTQTTVVTTTTTNTTTQGSDVHNHDGQNSTIHTHDHDHTGTHTHNNTATHNTSVCLVDDLGMAKVLSLVKEESFSENKLNVAKQFTKNKCLTVNQIKEVGKLFSFSSDKMKYVKYAYDYCLNTQDYYELNELFDFSDDKNTLNGFISSK